MSDCADADSTLEINENLMVNSKTKTLAGFKWTSLVDKNTVLRYEN
jgi:hypothetical protein